ncbi:histidine--tRNA ligase [Patescibacteria group bacterium]
MNKLIEPKILKGTRDFTPIDMVKRNLTMGKIRKIFESFGYSAIETPILNPAATILGKYGEEGDRLTYNFKDAGGRGIALPFDLTVPFARYVAANYRDLPMPFKRYQIQRVWRAEKPQKGRLREFYQCDVDVIGTRSLITEAEIAKIIVEVFTNLKITNFVVKFNSRRLMNAVLKDLGIAKDKVIQVIRTIDKLDKIGEEGVIKELEELKISKAKQILEFLKPEKDIEKTLSKLEKFDLEEIKEFIKYCKDFKIPKKYLEFDPSLARGLDYYTGITYEVISTDSDFGTICAGGRYDNLCGLFCDEDFSGVGVAFGFERIMLLLEQLENFKDVKQNSEVLITLFDENSSKDALNIYAELIQAEINAEVYFEPAKMKKQLKYADKKNVPFVIIQGPDEKEKEEVTIKNMKTGKQKSIPVNQLIDYFKGYITN